MKLSETLPVITARFQFSNQSKHLFRFFRTFKHNLDRLMFSICDIKTFDSRREEHLLRWIQPTSSVDPNTEASIYDNIFAEFSQKAVVSTLHRLHLLAKFDYVYILRDGYILDQGTFAHLRENSAVFQDLWRHQEAMAGR